jgi:hypothetical protein
VRKWPSKVSGDEAPKRGGTITMLAQEEHTDVLKPKHGDSPSEIGPRITELREKN